MINFNFLFAVEVARSSQWCSISQVARSSQRCSISPKNAAFATTNGNTGLVYILPNAEIRCVCYNRDGQRILRDKVWLLPNGQRITSTIGNTPYVMHESHSSSVVIPVASSSYNGMYTCGEKRDLSSTVSRVQIIAATKPGKSCTVYNLQQFCLNFLAEY